MQAREKVRDKVLDAKLNFKRKEGWNWNEGAMKALVTSKYEYVGTGAAGRHRQHMADRGCKVEQMETGGKGNGQISVLDQSAIEILGATLLGATLIRMVQSRNGAMVDSPDTGRREPLARLATRPSEPHPSFLPSFVTESRR